MHTILKFYNLLNSKDNVFHVICYKVLKVILIIVAKYLQQILPQTEQ